MDGTLLNSNHEVSSRFYEIFEGLKKRNIFFVAASGRQYSSMVSKLDKIRDDIIFIAENGAVIRKREEELSITPLQKGLVSELLDITNKIEDAHIMLCGKYTSYFDGKSAKFLNMLKEYYSDYEVLEDFKDLDKEIVKIAVYHSKSAEDYLYPKIKNYEDRVKVKVSGQHWLDINDVNAHKGNALQKIMDTYVIQPHELLVFGDYNNDLEMLQLTDYSFAMANAHPKVKEVAKFSTHSNDEYGVERILEKLT